MYGIGSVSVGSLNRNKVIPQSLNRNKIVPQPGSSGSSNKIFTLYGFQNLLLEEKVKLHACCNLKT